MTFKDLPLEYVRYIDVPIINGELHVHMAKGGEVLYEIGDIIEHHGTQYLVLAVDRTLCVIYMKAVGEYKRELAT